MNYLARAKKSLSPVQGHYTEIEINHGSGDYLYATDGKKYLDFAMGVAVASTGHCHPKVVKAITDQAKKLIHACTGVVYYDPNITLAEKLTKKLGHNLSSFFFCQSGTEAIEAALKLAKYVTQKPKILAFHGAFHGRSIGALSITSKEAYRKGYPLIPEAPSYPYPSTQNQATYMEGFIAHLEKYQSELAAVIIEPVLGEGGYIPCPPELLESIAKETQSRNILFICDEIQTGIGRTGKWFSFQHTNIVPDILTLAKGLASGLPLGAVAASPDLMSKWTTGAHGSTFGGNPVSCAAAIATLEVIEECLTQITPNANEITLYLKDRLATNSKTKDIRHQGYMIGIELESGEAVKKVMEECLAQDLILISCGKKSEVIRLIPSLTIDKETLKKGCDILIDVLNQ